MIVLIAKVIMGGRWGIPCKFLLRDYRKSSWKRWRDEIPLSAYQLRRKEFNLQYQSETKREQ